MCFNTFLHSAENARKRRDENPISSVVAETLKLLASSSFGDQKTDGSRLTLTNYLNVENKHAAINNKLLKKLNAGKNARVCHASNSKTPSVGTPIQFFQ